MRGNAALLAALPVAGRSGTLAFRMRRTAAQDRCQAKTGTLSNVSALAGYCSAANGHLLAFAFIENLVYTPSAKAAEDRLVVALARSRPAGAAPVVAPTPTTPPTTTPPRRPRPAVERRRRAARRLSAAQLSYWIAPVANASTKPADSSATPAQPASTRRSRSCSGVSASSSASSTNGSKYFW